jgi:hypothetical protein
MLKWKLLFLRPLCGLIFDDVSFFGPRLLPNEVIYSRLGGRTASLMMLVFKEEKIFVSLKKNENKELKKFWKHTSVTTLSYSNLIEKHFSVHFNMEALELGTETLYLLHGINYDANEESGLGQGRVYATPTFLGQQNIVRHDFVEVKIKEKPTERGLNPEVYYVSPGGTLYT